MKRSVLWYSIRKIMHALFASATQGLKSIDYCFTIHRFALQLLHKMLQRVLLEREAVLPPDLTDRPSSSAWAKVPCQHHLQPEIQRHHVSAPGLVLPVQVLPQLLLPHHGLHTVRWRPSCGISVHILGPVGELILAMRSCMEFFRFMHLFVSSRVFCHLPNLLW